MPRNDLPALFVVDGSNIATEGRSAPSLEQLNEAVLAFLEAHPSVKVTVVVDATFGHRIAKKEVKAFDEAVANNELVTPPAGAVGRGDAFVLAIADRANAGILSNDSFQEFHGEFEWLFEDGRLIGGKPVPHVGWVFVHRTPVRGPKSRQAIREANDDAPKRPSKRGGAKRSAKKAAAAPVEDPATDEPETTTDAPGDEAAEQPPAKRSRRGRRSRGKETPLEPAQQETIEAAKAATPKEYVNELVPFLEFVEHHPVGTSISAVIDSYSSHGAYAKCDDVLVYIPLRLMDDPAPRSARSVLSMGEAVTVVIVGYVPERRSIDAALPQMAGDVAVTAGSASPGTAAEAGDDDVVATPAKRTRKRAAAKTTTTTADAPEDTTATVGSSPAPATPTTSRKAAEKKAPAKKTAARKTAAKKTPAKTTPAKKTAAKKTPAKTTPAKKTPAKQGTATTPAADSTTTTAKKGRAKQTAAKQTPAKKTAAKKAPAKKAPAKTTPAKKAAAKAGAGKRAAKKAPAKKSSGASSSSSESA